MYKPIEISKDVFYVGVNDRSKALFENMWPLPKGVSYNSYLVVDEKTVLIDTVDISYSDLFFKKIDATIGAKEIDYLVVNHMEPDHSGSIELIVSRYPNIKIIGNKRTVDMLKGYYGVVDNVIVVDEGETVSIGEKDIQFFMAPMVHWPETMVTYVPQNKTLFSGDAFGTFGALDGGVTDKYLNLDDYRDEMYRYYSNIVGKFGSPVQTAIKKLSSLAIDAICSTHGPMWTKKENVDEVINIYDKLSRYEGEDGVVIVYGSMYGNTGVLADYIASVLADNGVEKIIIHKVSKSHESYILRDIFKYKGLIIGSPTYNNKLYPAVDSIVNAIESRSLKNRFFGCFGSFTWSDATAKNLKQFAEGMNFEMVAEPVVMKQSMMNEVFEQADILGSNMAKHINDLK